MLIVMIYKKSTVGSNKKGRLFISHGEQVLRDFHFNVKVRLQIFGEQGANVFIYKEYMYIRTYKNLNRLLYYYFVASAPGRQHPYACCVSCNRFQVIMQLKSFGLALFSCNKQVGLFSSINFFD